MDKRLKQLLNKDIELRDGAMLDTYNQAIHNDVACAIRCTIDSANCHYVVEEIPFNTAEGGVCRTIKAQYYKNGLANFVRADGLGATCVLVKIKRDAEDKQNNMP